MAPSLALEVTPSQLAAIAEPQEKTAKRFLTCPAVTKINLILDRGKLDPLLRDCMPNSKQPAINRIVARYIAEVKWELFGVEQNGKLAAVIGLAFEGRNAAEVKHLSIDPKLRRQGLGKVMIAAAAAKFKLKKITAQCDKTYSAFYERCGFKVTAVEGDQFLCELKL